MLFDHLVGAGEQRGRQVEAKPLCSFKVDHQLVFGRRLHRETGGLLAFEDAVDIAGRAADYIDRIFKGEKPADLPVQAPTKYELVINLKTAKALGLTIPDKLVALADEVIE